MSLQVELVSPERILYSGQADMVIARTVGGGEIAFLTGHAPFVGALDEVRISHQFHDVNWVGAQFRSMTGRFAVFGAVD